MTDRKELIEALLKHPILLNLKADEAGGAIGSLSIPRRGKDIALTYIRDSEQGFIGESFSAESPYGYFFISFAGRRSSSGQLIDRLNGQHEKSYDYILFSNQNDVVKSKKFNKAVFRYYTFIEGIPVGKDEPVTISLFDHIKQIKKVCKDFRVDVKLSSRQRMQAFPTKRTVEYDMINFDFVFTKPKTIEEIKFIQHKLNNYLTMFLQAPIKPIEVILQIDGNKNNRPRYCYLIESDAFSDIPKPTERKNALSFSKQGKEFLKHLTNAIYLQDNFPIPINLIRVYWLYKDKKIYLDNQVSVLLSCIESLYVLINKPSERQAARETNYKIFTEKLDEISIANDLKEWLLKSGGSYIERKSFSEKVKIVVRYAGRNITNQRADKLKDLRNDLMHGRFPNWQEYLKDYYERRVNEESDKIDIEWLAWVLSVAILKVIKQAK